MKILIHKVFKEKNVIEKLKREDLEFVPEPLSELLYHRLYFLLVFRQLSQDPCMLVLQ